MIGLHYFVSLLGPNSSSQMYCWTATLIYQSAPCAELEQGSQDTSVLSIPGVGSALSSELVVG